MDCYGVIVGVLLVFVVGIVVDYVGDDDFVLVGFGVVYLVVDVFV